LSLSNEWIRQCLGYLEIQGPLYSLSNEDIASKVLSIFIDCGDLREICVGDSVLPPLAQLAKVHNKPLLPASMDRIILQIDEVVNVGSPQETRREKGSKRLMKLFLTDGRNNIIGIELSSIIGLEADSPAGSKLVLFNKPQIKRGAILLSPSNCRFLGGESLRLADNTKLTTTAIDVSLTNQDEQPVRVVASSANTTLPTRPQHQQPSNTSASSAVPPAILGNPYQLSSSLAKNSESTFQAIAAPVASAPSSSSRIPSSRVSPPMLTQPPPVISTFTTSSHGLQMQSPEVSVDFSADRCSSDEEYSSSTIRRDSSKIDQNSRLSDYLSPWNQNHNDDSAMEVIEDAPFSPGKKLSMSSRISSGPTTVIVQDSPFSRSFDRKSLDNSRLPSFDLEKAISKASAGADPQPIDLTTPGPISPDIYKSRRFPSPPRSRSPYQLSSIRAIVDLRNSIPTVVSSDPKNLFPSSGYVRGTVIGVKIFSVIDSATRDESKKNSSERNIVKEYRVVVHFHDGECTIVAEVDSDVIAKLLNLSAADYHRKITELKAMGKAEYKSYNRSIMGQLCHLCGIFYMELISTVPSSSNLTKMSEIEDTVTEYGARLSHLSEVNVIDLCHDLLN
jgi:hypothetical protein